MKIHLDGRYQEIKYLRLIATYKFIDDVKSWIFVGEALVQLPDKSFLIRKDYKIGPVYNKGKAGSGVTTRKYKRVNNPATWLLTHGHERLAAVLFPELKIDIDVEFDCLFNEEDERRYKGETLYGTGETIGETFRGQPPIPEED